MSRVKRKKRKPRTRRIVPSKYTKSGFTTQKNYDLCPHCGNPHCDPIYSIGNMSPSMRKIQKRLREGKCMGCGKEPKKCSCKSKL